VLAVDAAPHEVEAGLGRQDVFPWRSHHYRDSTEEPEGEAPSPLSSTATNSTCCIVYRSSSPVPWVSLLGLSPGSRAQICVLRPLGLAHCLQNFVLRPLGPPPSPGSSSPGSPALPGPPLRRAQPGALPTELRPPSPGSPSPGSPELRPPSPGSRTSSSVPWVPQTLGPPRPPSPGSPPLGPPCRDQSEGDPHAVACRASAAAASALTSSTWSGSRFTSSMNEFSRLSPPSLVR